MPSFTTLILILAIGIQAAHCAPAASGSCVAGSIAGTTCQAQCGIDHAGGDYAAISASTFQACANACSSDARCVTAQWDNQRRYCYLKNALNAGTTTSTVDSVICRACPTGNFRVRLVSPSGSISYLYNTGDYTTPARDGQVMSFKTESSIYYLSGTTLVGNKPQADGTRSLVYAQPGDGIAYAQTPAQNIDYPLVEVRLTQSFDKCNVSFRLPNGNTSPAVYGESPTGGYAFFIQAASSTQNIPVTAYAVPA